MVVLKRTFHPVGQGAFFTEQFYDTVAGSVLYNVVYDCGSLTARNKTHMERTIRNCFYEKKEIDVLFLSHFDDDHVNYVKHLFEKGHLDGTRVFIPLLFEENWLRIEAYYKNYEFIQSLSSLSKGKTKIISVDLSSETDVENVNERRIRSIEELDGGTISSGTKLRPNLNNSGIIWYYVPFNIQYHSLINDFKNKLQANNLHFERLNDPSYVNDKTKELRSIYKQLGKRPKGGTSINFNSLLVMSYPKDRERCSLAGLFRWRWYRRWHIVGKNYPGSCLYTGDTSANEDVVWNRIVRMINRCLGCDERVHLLQIPHHGSKNSFDDKLLDSDCFDMGFTNYDPYYRQRIFDDFLPMRLAMRWKPIVLITNDYVSQYEECWKLS